MSINDSIWRDKGVTWARMHKTYRKVLTSNRKPSCWKISWKAYEQLTKTGLSDYRDTDTNGYTEIMGLPVELYYAVNGHIQLQDVEGNKHSA